MGQKTVYCKVVQQKVFEIAARSHQVGLRTAPHGILYVLKDSWFISYPPRSLAVDDAERKEHEQRSC